MIKIKKKVKDICDIPSRISKGVKNAKEAMRSTIEIIKWMIAEFMNPHEKKRIMQIFVLSVMGTVVYLGLSRIVGVYIQETTGESLFTLSVFGAVVALFTLTRVGTEYIKQLMAEWDWGKDFQKIHSVITQRFYEKSCLQLTQEKEHLSPSNLEENKGKVANMLQTIRFEIVMMLPLLALSAVGIIFLSWELFVFFTLPGFVVYIVLVMRAIIPVETDGIVADKGVRKAKRLILERWDKAIRVKTSGVVLEEFARAEESMNAAIEGDRKVWMPFTKKRIIAFGGSEVFRVAGFVYIAYATQTGSMSVATAIPLLAWTDSLLGNMWIVSNLIHKFVHSVPKLKSLRYALEIEPDVKNSGIDLPFLSGEIQIKNLSFAYQDKEDASEKEDKKRGREKEEGQVVVKDKEKKERSKKVLNNLSLTISSGKKVGIVGPSGAGKSTLIKLLMRFTDQFDGEILIGGRNLKEDVSYEALTKFIAYIPQRAQIMSGTLKYNVEFGSGELPDEKLEQLQKHFKLDFNGRLKKGWETEVGEDGLKLSGGEQQRVMAAAAVAEDARILIADEATASLDSETELMVQKGMDEMVSDETTSIFIAHRFSTLRSCNMIIVLVPGSDGAEIEYVADDMSDAYHHSPTFKRMADLQGLQFPTKIEVENN